MVQEQASEYNQQAEQKSSNNNRSLSFLLLLPLLCAVIFCASQLGVVTAPVELLNRRVTPAETANYSSWNELAFAPVEDGIITQVAAETSGVSIPIAGIATAAPTRATREQVSTSDNNGQGNTSQVAVAQTQTSNPQVQGSDIASHTQTRTSETQATETQVQVTASATLFSSETPTEIPTDVPIAPPNSIFGANPQQGSAPLTVNFYDISSGQVTSYLWDFGDGTTSTLASPSHTYTIAGEYSVRFTVTGPSGSSASGTRITVSDVDSDGDGILDSNDACPNQGDQGYGLQGNGCPNSPVDSDGDGILDSNDACPNQGDQGYGLQGNGCPISAPTNTPINTAVPTNTPIFTDTPTNTPIFTDTPTNTPIPTDTPTNTPIPTDTPTNTPIPTDTPTNTPIPTDTPTNTPIPTNTPVSIVINNISIIDVGSGTTLATLANTDSTSININTYPTLNIRANEASAAVKRVEFTVNLDSNIDNSSPFNATFSPGNTINWSPTANIYIISATPYDKTGSGGNAGTPVIVFVTIVNTP